MFLLVPAAGFPIYLIQKQPTEVAELNRVVNDANAAQVEIEQFQAHLKIWDSLFGELQAKADDKDGYEGASEYLDQQYSEMISFRTHLESMHSYSPEMSRLNPYSERMKVEAERLIALSNPYGGPFGGLYTNFKAGEFEDLLQEHSTFFKTVSPQLNEVVWRNKTQINEAKSRRLSIDIESWIGDVGAVYVVILCPIFVVVGIARKWKEIDDPGNSKAKHADLESEPRATSPKRRARAAKPKMSKNELIDESYEPDELDLAIMTCLYNSKESLEATIIAEIFGMRFGESDHRLERLEEKGLVARLGWVAGGTGFHLTSRGKKLIFDATSRKQT